MRTAIIILLAIALTGCAWSRGRTRIYDEGELVQDRHCWTIVYGKGRLGAKCTVEDTDLATEDTGFSDNFIRAVGAAAEGAARGVTP